MPDTGKVLATDGTVPLGLEKLGPHKEPDLVGFPVIPASGRQGMKNLVLDWRLTWATW